MPDFLDEHQCLLLLNDWLQCDPIAGDLLWYTDGLVETKSLNEHFVDLTRAYCAKNFSRDKNFFYWKLWFDLDDADQESLVRDMVLGWQVSMKDPDSRGHKQPGDFAAWRAFLGYLSTCRQQIKTKLKAWHKARGAHAGKLSEVVDSTDEEIQQIAAGGDEDGQSPEITALIEQCNELAEELVNAFRASLHRAPAKLTLLECITHAYQRVLYALEVMEKKNEHYPFVRDCAFAQGMSQDAYNQNTSRLREKWAEFRSSEPRKSQWRSLRNALHGDDNGQH